MNFLYQNLKIYQVRWYYHLVLMLVKKLGLQSKVLGRLYVFCSPEYIITLTTNKLNFYSIFKISQVFVLRKLVGFLFKSAKFLVEI